jgi:hypothetical protein
LDAQFRTWWELHGIQVNGLHEIPIGEAVEPGRARQRWDAEFEELRRVFWPICNFSGLRARSSCATQLREERAEQATRCRRCIRRRHAKEARQCT